jgi:hypothetical protein
MTFCTRLGKPDVDSAVNRGGRGPTTAGERTAAAGALAVAGGGTGNSGKTGCDTDSGDALKSGSEGGVSYCAHTADDATQVAAKHPRIVLVDTSRPPDKLLTQKNAAADDGPLRFL